jgi:hypothetical protein
MLFGVYYLEGCQKKKLINLMHWQIDLEGNITDKRFGWNSKVFATHKTQISK